MPTVVVSLGSIVNTDAKKAIAAFQALANDLGLGIQVLPLMPKLQSFFMDFNLGKLSTEDFKLEVSKIFFESAQKQGDDSKKAFSDAFENCWNAMCEIDQQARDVVEYIAKQSLLDTQNKMRVYSDTNDMHFDHFTTKMSEWDDSSEEIKILVDTTCASQCSKEALLLRIVEELREKNPQEEITLVLGKNDQIKDPTLLAMTEERDAKVVNAANAAQVMIKRLEGPRISVAFLKSLVPVSRTHRRSASTSLPMIPAFNAMQLREDSPRPGTQGAVQPLTDEPLLDRSEHRDRSPSPT